MEPLFDEIKGVISTTVGYTGGTVPSPSYEQVSSGKTGHVEAVEILYDPKYVSYENLLTTYWRNIDPTTAHGQFVDFGSQYRPVIFYHTEKQKQLAESSKKALSESGRFSKPIVTEIRPGSVFYPAENYHQDFYKKSPVRYKTYKAGSGRKSFLKKIWDKKK